MNHRVSLLKTLAIGLLRSRWKQKIFCVGLNKTGTVSLTKVLEGFGIAVAPQPPAERLINDWSRRDFRRLIRYCRYFQAFQDVPFSCPFTFQALDWAYPSSKFILTVRQDADQWCQSLIRYHSKLFGGGNVPSEKDLKAAGYCYPGFALDFYQAVFGSSVQPLYDPAKLRRFYEFHNASIVEYFRHRPNDLLVLEVSQENAMSDLCRFLGRPVTNRAFPWLNKTDDVVLPATRPHAG